MKPHVRMLLVAALLAVVATVSWVYTNGQPTPVMATVVTVTADQVSAVTDEGAVINGQVDTDLSVGDRVPVHGDSFATSESGWRVLALVGLVFGAPGVLLALLHSFNLWLDECDRRERTGGLVVDPSTF